MTKDSPQRRSLRFRGRSFLALVLTPEMPVSEWLAEIDSWLARSPMFFTGKPLILDASKLALPRADFLAMLESLAKRQIEIMGIEGANPAWLGAGLPPVLTGSWKPAAVDTSDGAAPAAVAKSAMTSTLAEPAAEEAAPRPAPFPSLLIEEPVRSGQSIHFQEGDVTVLGSVASGAEIIAGGSIHVYGTLRGRALAGAYGNPQARIFTRRLEAELLSIDGLYKVAEDLEPRLRKQPVHAWLDGDAMKISVLN